MDHILYSKYAFVIITKEKEDKEIISDNRDCLFCSRRIEAKFRQDGGNRICAAENSQLPGVIHGYSDGWGVNLNLDDGFGIWRLGRSSLDLRR